ncbi:MAG: hypothetical protein ACU0AU_13050, partial [Cognatishimia activa]
MRVLGTKHRTRFTDGAATLFGWSSREFEAGRAVLIRAHLVLFVSSVGFWLATFFDIVMISKRYAGGLVCYRQT